MRSTPGRRTYRSGISAEPLPADDVLAILGEVFDVEVDEFKRRRHSSPLRAVAARYLIRYAGQSQRDVADLLNIGSGSAVCKQLKPLCRRRLASDRQLRRLVRRAEQQLNAARQALTKEATGV